MRDELSLDFYPDFHLKNVRRSDRLRVETYCTSHNPALMAVRDHMPRGHLRERCRGRVLSMRLASLACAMTALR